MNKGLSKSLAVLYMPIAWFKGTAEQVFRFVAQLAPPRGQHLDSAPRHPRGSSLSSHGPASRPSRQPTSRNDERFRVELISAGARESRGRSCHAGTCAFG